LIELDTPNRIAPVVPQGADVTQCQPRGGVPVLCGRGRGARDVGHAVLWV